MMVTVSRVDTAICEVGEGAHWDERAQVLLFLDIIGRKVHRFDPATGVTTSWETPEHAGAMALCESGGVMLGMTQNFVRLDPDDGSFRHFARLSDVPAGPINDGKADFGGRFVVGRCGHTDPDPRPDGGLFSADSSARVTQLDGGIHLSNSVCFSTDGRTLYLADSHTHDVFAYDYDVAAGTVANRRLFINTDTLGGVPDGATADADGLIWMAIFGAGKIAALRADGTVERTIDIPVKMVSSVAFGGSTMDKLYVTSLMPSYFGGAPEEHGGAVFVVEGLGARGLPEPRFAA